MSNRSYLEYDVVERFTNKPYLSEEAVCQLGNVGIAIKKWRTIDSYNIAQRDCCLEAFGTNPSYIMGGFSGMDLQRTDYGVATQGVDVGFYLLGVRQKEYKKEGEVGEIHLSPALRNRGLGKLLFLLSHIQLIEQKANCFRAVVGDESGKVVDWLRKIGYHNTGEIISCLEHPIWKMDIQDSDTLIKVLFKEFSDRINAIKPNCFCIDPEEVDIDNPLRVDLEKTVLQRLHNQAADRVFGYPGALIYLWRGPDRENGQRLVLEASILLPADCKGILLTPFNKPPYTLISDSIHSSKELEDWGQYFASLANNIVHN